MLNKGAMFGLDARIALAIFGALSVISGAALYSAIKQARVVAFVTELEEIGKALIAYNLDVGADIPIVSGDQAKTEFLIENSESVDNWKGPYISGYKKGVTVNAMKDSEGRSTYILYANTGGAGRVPCDGVKICYVWVHKTGVSTSLVKNVDEYVDGSQDLNSGKIQGADYSVSIPGTHTISYMVGLKLKQTL